MYSDKKNILQLVSLLIEHEISNVVLCPGSRNAPIIQTLANHSFFTCHSITDERGAAFFALGLALHGGKPAAVVCTSGTALLNMHPAVAEAFYQQVPLVVISADRPQAWIGQMDGQTVPQSGVFGSLVRKSVNLPDVNTEEELWYCNRLINEALLELNHHGKGPVHINVPLTEPLFSFTTEVMPSPRVITRYKGLNAYDKNYDDLIAKLNKYNKRMMVVGQMMLIYLFEKRAGKQLYKFFTWFTEHTSNRTIPGMPIKNFDAILYSLDEEQKEKLRPELVITYGGHIVSKRLKKYLREYPPKEHWHVSLDGEVVDLYGSVTTIIEMDPFEFMEKIAFLIENKPTQYPIAWEQLSKALPAPEFSYSAMSTIGALLKFIPEVATLHLGNSSTIRYAQLFPLADTIEVCSNRGTAGIDGSLSTALGYASSSDKINFIVIGDLSFFYDMNALWSSSIKNNVRILMINNGGGEIFQSIPGFNINEAARRFITVPHRTSAAGWVKERNFLYLSAHNAEELAEAMANFTQPEEKEQPMFLEVFTNKEEDVRLLKDYFHSLKQK